MNTLDPERLLRSAVGRCALGLVLVGVLSLGSTYQLDVMLASRGRDVDFGDELLRQLLQWGLWGVAAWPVSLAAGALWRRLGPWPLSLLLTALLTLGLGWGHAALAASLSESLLPFPLRPVSENPDLSRSEQRGERLGHPPWGSRGPPFAMRGARVSRSVVQCGLLLGLIGGCQIFLSIRRKERRVAAAELSAASAREHLVAVQLDVLRGQVHPHFLFNALHAVGGLVREGQDARALSTLASLSDLLRSSLDLGGEQLVSLGDELSLVQRYIDIETIRFGDRLSWRTDIDEAALAASVPSLLLLPLVENAVRYAVEPRATGGQLVLSGQLDGGELLLELWDDGPGFSEEQLAGAPAADDGVTHLGLSSTRERLQMMYGEASTFALGAAAGGGALVTVRLPGAGVTS